MLFTINGLQRSRARSGTGTPHSRISEIDALKIESAVVDLLGRESRRRAEKNFRIGLPRDRIAAPVDRSADPGEPSISTWAARRLNALRRTWIAPFGDIAAYLTSAIGILAAKWDSSATPEVRPKTATSDGEVRIALSECKRAFWSAAIFSGVVNLLMLAGPLYMLQVYDRVLASRSVPTLVALSLFLLLAFAFQGALDIVRVRVVSRTALLLDEHLGTTAHRAVMRLALQTRHAANASLPVRDLDQIRGFLGGAGPIAIVDLPWIPVFLIICFLIHPVLGVIALIGGLLLLSLTILTERASRVSAGEVALGAGTRAAMLEADRRNSETIAAMGMAPALTARWQALNTRYLTTTTRCNDVVNSYGSISKIVRLLLQSAMLGLGAYLVIRDELSAGGMIAASIMMSRALAPIETVIANWRGFVAARLSIRRLTELLDRLRSKRTATMLPRPKRRLDVEELVVTPPGAQAAILSNVHFSLIAGEALGILGPSGAGKTSLVRTLLGIWAPARGGIRLDNAMLDQWDPEIRGRYIGYVSQNVELFDGTVAENISRMDSEADSDAVLRAAQAAGAHDMILRLPSGYDTNIGEMGAVLSGGQRQRIALARALYGDPFLVIFDEPNANLDSAGEAALHEVICRLKVRRAIVVLIAHDPSLFSECDKILLLGNGTQQAFGPRDEIWRRLTRRYGSPAAASGSLTLVSDRGFDR